MVHGAWWSGQLPLRKRSGQIFMAMVTQSPLYENYELDAIVTVLSDAAIFNSTSSGNFRSLDDSNEQSNGRTKFEEDLLQTSIADCICPASLSCGSHLATDKACENIMKNQ